MLHGTKRQVPQSRARFRGEVPNASQLMPDLPIGVVDLTPPVGAVEMVPQWSPLN